MKIDYRKAAKSILNAAELRAGKEYRLYGFLGRADGTIVSDRPNYVYIRTQNDDEIEAFNDVVSTKRAGLGVVVSFSKDRPYWHITDAWQPYGDPVPRGLREHADTHGPFGPDPLWVWAEQYMPWNVKPLGEFNVRVFRGAFLDDDNLIHAPGYEDLDLSSHKPTTGARYALIELLKDGTLHVADGSIVGSRYGLVDLSKIPAATSGALRLCAVALYVGQTALTWTPEFTDFVDLRGCDYGSGGGGGTGDMLKSVYDPQGIEGDAFDLALHTGVVAARKIEPLKVSPTTGLIVSVPDTPVYRSTLDTSPPYARWQHLTTTLNLSLGVPVSGARWVLVYLSVMPDSPASLAYINGATVASKGDLTWNDIPGFTSYVDRGTYPLAAVVLEAGQTEIAESDILDLRFAGMDAGGVIPRLANGVTGNGIVIYGGGTELDVSGKTLADLLEKNTAITGATKTKITYDSKGLVTGGADATAADVGAEPANANIQAHIASTVNPHNTTASQVGADVTTETVHAATGKTTPVDTDEVPLLDSAASFGLKKFTWANIKATLKTYFDGLYAALAGLSTQVFSVGAATAVAHAVRADQLQTQGVTAYTTGGTSTAFTLTTLGTPVALTTNERWTVKFNQAAGATPTLNRDAKGAKALKYYNAAGVKTACGATTIIANMIADVVYDGTDYVVLDIAARIAHGDMTDVGTSTHAQIDTHIGASNPHSGSQPLDADLTAIAGLTPADDDILQRKSSAWVNRTIAQLLADLGIVAKTSWTPTFTNLSVGNGTLTCEYIKSGSFVHAQVHLVFGSTTSISGSVSFTLPSGSMTTKAVQPLGMLTCNDAGTAQYSGVVHQNDANSVLLRTFTVSGSNIVQSALSATVPLTWGTGDRLTAEFSYIQA